MNNQKTLNELNDRALEFWVEKIKDKAALVLEKRGLLVEDNQLREVLLKTPGIKIKGTRVFFMADKTAAFFEQYRKCHPFIPSVEYNLRGTEHAHHITAMDGQVRPITLQDIETGTRLYGALGAFGIRGSAPGIPQDVPPALRSLAQLIAGAKNKPGYPTFVPSEFKEEKAHIAECLKVLGYGTSIGVHLVSPLKFIGQEVENALEQLRGGLQASVGIGTMPMLGLSAPMSVLSGFVVALAEVAGGGMIFEILGVPMERLRISVNTYPVDMRSGNFVYGTPANLASTVIGRAVNRWLGTEITAKTFCCSAQTPGPQACAQKAAFTGLAAALGMKRFSGAGSLSVDEIFSPVQLIFDREIFNYVQRSCAMTAESLNDDLFLLDDLLENEEDNFMASPATAKYCRVLQWDSDIFPNRMLAQWETAGRPSEQEAAAAEIQRLLAGYDYRLPEDKASELDRIFDRAAENTK